MRYSLGNTVARESDRGRGCKDKTAPPYSGQPIPVVAHNLHRADCATAEVQEARKRQITPPQDRLLAVEVAVMMARLPRRHAPGEPLAAPWLAHFER